MNLKNILLVALCFLHFGSVAQALVTNDLSWLLTVNPESVTDDHLGVRAIEQENLYQKYHQSHGILYEAYYEKSTDQEPTRMGAGGDTALFTGFYLATAAFRFAVTRAEGDIDKVLQTLRGIHILTHISGTPGVLARAAFPAAEAAKWQYPDGGGWPERLKKDFIYESSSAVEDILNKGEAYPRMIFRTRTTRDQSTGVLFGLAVALATLRDEGSPVTAVVRQKMDLAVDIISVITQNFYKRVESQNFKLYDHKGESGTTAKDISGLHRLQLLALYREVLKIKSGLGGISGSDSGGGFAGASTGDVERSLVNELSRIGREYEKNFDSTVPLSVWNSVANYFTSDYYAWNLRFARLFSLWVLDTEKGRRDQIFKYAHKYVWSKVRHDDNAFFSLLYYAMKGSSAGDAKRGLTSLKRFYFRPMRDWSSPLAGQQNEYDGKVVPAHLREPTRYFVWQKDPDVVGEAPNTQGLMQSPGLSYLLPYWIARHYRFVNSPELPSPVRLPNSSRARSCRSFLAD